MKIREACLDFKDSAYLANKIYIPASLLIKTITPSSPLNRMQSPFNLRTTKQFALK